MPHARVELLCRAADFLLLGSRDEGSADALLEALACGATPVVTDIPPFRALTGRGAVGALAAPGDAAGFADALVALRDAPRPELRRRAIAHFRGELSPPALGSRLVDVYRELLEERRAERTGPP